MLEPAKRRWAKMRQLGRGSAPKGGRWASEGGKGGRGESERKRQHCDRSPTKSRFAVPVFFHFLSRGSDDDDANAAYFLHSQISSGKLRKNIVTIYRLRAQIRWLARRLVFGIATIDSRFDLSLSRMRTLGSQKTRTNCARNGTATKPTQLLRKQKRRWSTDTLKPRP